MKQHVNINAFIISENTHNVDLKYNLFDLVQKTISITSIPVNRKNLSRLHQKLNSALDENPDLFIFEIDLPNIISRQVIRRIHQRLGPNTPAIIVAKTDTEKISSEYYGSTIKIVINKPDDAGGQQAIKNTMSNLWHIINLNK